VAAAEGVAAAAAEEVVGEAGVAEEAAAVAAVVVMPARGGARAAKAAELTNHTSWCAGRGLHSQVHISASREHFLSHVLGYFAGFSDKHGSG
jgi:hypothetical protein